MEGDLQTALKNAMRTYPQGVTVVTTSSGKGPKGITVSSFISVSLDPPLVLVSIGKSSPFHNDFRDARAFAINFLADDQKAVSERFAGRTDASDRFEGIEFGQGETGSPILGGVKGVLECRSWRVYDGGDHSILVGEVVSAKTLNSKRPLVYYSQRYTTTELVESPASPSDQIR